MSAGDLHVGSLKSIADQLRGSSIDPELYAHHAAEARPHSVVYNLRTQPSLTITTVADKHNDALHQHLLALYGPGATEPVERMVMIPSAPTQDIGLQTTLFGEQAILRIFVDKGTSIGEQQTKKEQIDAPFAIFGQDARLAAKIALMCNQSH